MHHKSTLLFASLALYVTGAAAVEYQGFCTIEAQGRAASTRGCSIRMDYAASPIDGKVYRVQFDGGRDPTVIRVSGSSCMAGGVPCIEQPSPFPGNLQFTDRSGSTINIPVPPTE